MEVGNVKKRHVVVHPEKKVGAYTQTPHIVTKSPTKRDTQNAPAKTYSSGLMLWYLPPMTSWMS